MPSAARFDPNHIPLPTKDIPPDVKARFDPWVAGFVGLTPVDAKARVVERWSAIQRPSLIALRDTLLKFEVQAIAKGHSGYVIETYRDGSDDPGIGDYWYLPGPMDRAEIDKRLSAFGLQGNEALRDFLFFFGGLAEDIQTSGHFISAAAPWVRFSDEIEEDFEAEEIEGYADWADALMFYHARNGCDLLVRSDGKVAWWVMQEQIIDPVADDFDGFIQVFDKHRQISWPYDPYGPDDDD